MSFFLNPQVRTCSVDVPGTAPGNNDSENREPTRDRSLGDPCPEAMFSTYHSVNLSHSVLKETHYKVTGVGEEILFCSPGTSSGKQKKARSTSLPQLRSENTPATIEADQILLPFRQLATKSNSANFNNIINRVSKLPKSFTTTMPTFDGQSEKFEQFDDLFQTSLEVHNEVTEEDKINYFHSVMRGDGLQTFRNITRLNRENLGDILSVFSRKYVKPQSQWLQQNTNFNDWSSVQRTRSLPIFYTNSRI